MDCTRSVLSVEGELVLCHLWFLFYLLRNLLLVLLMTGRLGMAQTDKRMDQSVLRMMTVIDLGRNI